MLSQFLRRDPAPMPVTDLTAELMREAMGLGAIWIWQGTDLYGWPRATFVVEIRMRIGTSKVEARGEASDLNAALSEAIQAARRFREVER